MSSKERKYRVISGIAYPPLVKGSHKSRKVKARLDDPFDTSFYHDESIRISEAEMSSFVGKPICIEHNERVDVGEVTHVFADEKGTMRMTGRIYVDPDDPADIGHEVMTRVEDGRLTGMSVGYDFATVKASDGSVEIDYKKPKEITLCLEPFFGGACVSVTASNTLPQQSKKTTLHFQIMASESSSTIPPPVKPNEEASTLALETDRLAKRMQELEEQNKQLAERVRLADDAEEKRLAEYARNKRSEFDEIMKINEQQFREENGPDAVLPAAYREASEGVALNPSPDTVAAWQGITASARAWKRERDAKMAQQQQLEEMSRKLKALEDDRASAMQTVQASANKVAETVHASADRQPQITKSNLFIRAAAPSEAEREIARMNYGHLSSASAVHGVLASAKPVEVRAAPLHPHLDKVRNSLRNRNAALFALLNGSDYSGVHVNVKSETWRDGEKVGQ
jgi:hypothetical protein